MTACSSVMLLCLLLGLSLTCGQGVGAVSGGVSTRDALGKIGIAADCQIVVGDDCDDVERTAAEMIGTFVARGSLAVSIVTDSQSKDGWQIVLGRESNLRAIKRLADKGIVRVRGMSPQDDGFHVTRASKTIVIAGANAKGVLNGAYAFRDYVEQGAAGKLDIRKVPAFRSRFQFIPTYLMQNHPSSYTEATEKTASYLARLGVNGVVDGGGACWDLSRFVSSDVFPFQKAPDSALQNHVAKVSAVFTKYGIDYYLMLWEPLVARGNAEIGAYPPDVLGTVKRSWGGDQNGQDRTLCVSSPVVQEHYKNLVRKFVKQYPNVKGFLFYNLDADSWLCTPELCPRCKAVCAESLAAGVLPWETQAAFTDLLARTAKETRPGFGFIHWISHFTGEAAESLVRTSREYTGLAHGPRTGDHDVFLADSIRPEASEFRMLQKVCAERAVPFYMTFSSNSHEVIPNGFQFPSVVGDSMRRLYGWGIRNILGCGPMPYFNQVNALAEKAFQWDPEQDGEAFVKALSVRQFGPEAGKLMYRAWEEIADGMRIWKDSAVHPFCGSNTPTALGFSYFTFANAILPDILEHYTPIPSDYPEKFPQMRTHFAKAAALAKEAISKADPKQPIGVSYYDGDHVPTMREYAELNYGPLSIADTFCRLRCHAIDACLLLKGMAADRAAGNHAAVKEKEAQYHELIRQDIAVRRSFVELLTQFSKMRPCLTRTSLSEEGIAGEIAYMNTEIGRMEAFLSQKTR